MTREEMVSITKEELDALKDRNKRLALDKSYLQLIIHMIGRLGAVESLDNVVLAIPRIILDNIGGTNLKLYYIVDDETFYADAFGENRPIETIDDEAVANVFETKGGAFLEHDFADTMMLTQAFTKAWDWVYPLIVGTQIIGVLKMENLHIGIDDWREYLPSFFGHVALLLKNEILGASRLQKAYNELEKEVEARWQAEEEIELINEKLSSINASLEEEIAVRMEAEEELTYSNKQLMLSRGELEDKVVERTKELHDTMIELGHTSEEWVQAMDAFGDIIYLLDADRHLVRANKRFYSALGLNPQNAVGRHISGLLHPNASPLDCPVCNAQMSKKDSVFVVEADDIHNPTKLPLEVTIKVIRDEQQAPIAILTSLHDLTHTRKIEQELRILNESLELRVQEEVGKNREKDLLLIKQSRLAILGDMLSNIAHHWRQPLNALGITVQDVKFAFQDNEIDKEYVDKMVSDSMRLINHMSHTIDNFRSFFRPDKESELFDVTNATKDAGSLMQDVMSNGAIEFEVQILSEELYTFGYRHEFAQVILNLLNNAKDALLISHINSPKVILSLERYGTTAVVSVEDNAGGIDVEVLDKIFNPYFTTKEQGKGVGLGLYMSKMLVEQHMNGNLYVKNKNGGACFSVEIPLNGERDFIAKVAIE
jgi:PAS domain S-box-containing protein